MLAAVTDAKAPMQVSVSALKRDEAACYISAALTKCAWLPKPLRVAAVAQHNVGME